jgi:hypothetical protein
MRMFILLVLCLILFMGSCNATEIKIDRWNKLNEIPEVGWIDCSVFPPQNGHMQLYVDGVFNDEETVYLGQEVWFGVNCNTFGRHIVELRYYTNDPNKYIRYTGDMAFFDRGQQIPEFPTIIAPVAVILGLVLIFGKQN